MKKQSIFSGSKNVFLFSLCAFMFLSFYYMPLKKEAPFQENIPVVSNEEDFSHCDPIFNSAYFFCPGNYQIVGTIPTENGCDFTWLGNANCQGITTNVTELGNTVTISGVGAPGAYCRFFYRLSDDHGNSWTYMFGIRFYEEDSPECCINPPCQ